MATTFEVKTDPIETDPTTPAAVQGTFEIDPNVFSPELEDTEGV